VKIWPSVVFPANILFKTLYKTSGKTHSLGVGDRPAAYILEAEEEEDKTSV
jgi:hypothetical protein